MTARKYPVWLIAILVVELVLAAGIPALLYMLAWGNMPTGAPPAQFLDLASEDRFFLIPLVLWPPLALASILFWRSGGERQAILCALAPVPLGVALIVYMLAS
jgi:hypothetical protein